jgi:redox-sensitive bicupin YhaK (pirin superfamily)
MLAIRNKDERGVANFGWLNSRHTFSFGEYHDQRFMGFAPLRVINEDRVAPARGFDTHGHRDMEIITYVISGALLHEDNMGNGSVIRPGDVQRMSAGSGVRHSEYNASSEEEVHFLQIWIEPKTLNLQPSYEQKAFSDAEKTNRLRLVGSGSGREGSITIHRDVDLYVGVLEHGVQLQHVFSAGRRGWLQLIRGEVDANSTTLSAGDGLSIQDTEILNLRAITPAELLIFDMD